MYIFDLTCRDGISEEKYLFQKPLFTRIQTRFRVLTKRVPQTQPQIPR